MTETSEDAESGASDIPEGFVHAAQLMTTCCNPPEDLFLYFSLIEQIEIFEKFLPLGTLSHEVHESDTRKLYIHPYLKLYPYYKQRRLEDCMEGCGCGCYYKGELPDAAWHFQVEMFEKRFLSLPEEERKIIIDEAKENGFLNPDIDWPIDERLVDELDVYDMFQLTEQ